MALENYGATVDRNSNIVLDAVCTSATNNAKKRGTRLQLWEENTSSACQGDNQIWGY